MSEHAEGPWKLSDHVTGVVLDASGCVVCDTDLIWLGPEGPTRAERDANARLIAAAPELLKELEEAGKIIWNMWGLLRRSNMAKEDTIYVRSKERQTAIAKATGETQ